MTAAQPARGGRGRVLAILACLVVGLVLGAALGFLGGRATAPTVADKIATSKAHGNEVIALLQELPSTYEQTRLGEGGHTDATFATTLDVVRHRLDKAIDVTPWFGERTINEVQVAVDRLRTDARSHVDPVRFSTDTDRAIDVISKAFGVLVVPHTPS